MPKLKNYILLILIVSYCSLSAQLSFTENKGQWPAQVAYKLNATLYQVYFENDGFTINIVDGEELFSSSVHHGHKDVKAKRLEKIDAHAYKMQFIDANQNVQISGSDEKPSYENYIIGNDKSKWATDVKSFHELYYKELYSSIDLKIYEKTEGFKYDFIVKAGADYREIQMAYKGVNRFALTNGDLKIITSVGKIIETKPYVYQIINGKEHEIDAEYVLQNQVLSFKLLEEYNEKYDLIIDPSLIFSTYSGATSDNWGFTACSDQLGNVYSGGIIFNTGYPVTLGSFQIAFAGGETTSSTYLGTDITISKYNPDGSTLLWTTYLGGTASEEMPHSIVVNELNELIVFGTTGSSDYPTTPSAYDITFNGGPPAQYDGSTILFSYGVDIFVSKLSADGTQMLASTFVGGTGNDGLNYRNYYNALGGNDSLYYNYADGARGEVISDNKSGIYVGTSTFSTDFPMVNGFQMTSNGMQEGVVFKLSSDLSNLMWSSYLGGSHDDAIYSLEIDEDGEAYVAGGTVSNNFPTTVGAYQTTFQGGTTDGFVAHINAFGNQLLASTLFGSPEYDQAYFVRRDKFKNVFIVGQTEATGSTLIYNAAYNTPNSGQFIAKFQPGLSNLEWSTVFGTGVNKPNISISAFAVDICNRVYLSGWGREFAGYGSTSPYWGTTFGTVGMETTPNAVQSVTDGQDFYIMVMDGDAAYLDYATFFGEQHSSGNCGNDHVDGGTSRFDRMGNIYQSVCASCGTVGAPANTSCNGFPTTAGAAFEDNGGYPNTTWVCNNAVYRFSFADDIAVADFFANSLVCENIPIQFTNTGIGAQYFWDFGDSSPIVNIENPNHLFPGPGTYDVTFWTIDSSSCNFSDTIVKTIIIQDQISQTLDTDTICLGESVQIGIAPESNHSYIWGPITALSNPISSSPIASPTLSTNYTLLVSDGVCNDTVWHRVEVLNIQYQLIGLSDTIICENSTVELIASYNTAVDSVQWSSSPFFTDVLNPTGSDNIFVSPANSQDFYVQTFDSVCNVRRRDTVSVQIDNPEIDFLGTPIFCMTDSSQITAQLTNSTISTINWSPSAPILSGQATSSVFVGGSNAFWLLAEIENSRGCPAIDSIFISVDEVQSSYVKENLLCNAVCTGQIELDYSGIAPFIFDWNTTAAEDSVYNLCAGDYYVIITDSLGCKDSLYIELIEPTAVDIQIVEIQNTACGDLWNSGRITVNVSGGTPPYNYHWTNGDNTHIADELPVGTYSLTLTDANFCVTTISANIEDPSTLELGLLSTAITCYDSCNATSIVNIIVPSTPPYSFLWNNTATTDSIGGLCEGIYTVTVSDIDSCIRINSVNISNPSPVHAYLGVAEQACHGDLTTAAVSAEGGTPDYTYLWSDNQTTKTAVGLSDGHYSVSVYDSYLCLFVEEFDIQGPPILLIDTFASLINCEIACNGTARIEVSGGEEPYTYLWDNLSTEDHASSLCVGKHQVVLTDHRGCIDTTELSINVNPEGMPLEATANPSSIYAGGSSQLQATEVEGYIYNWEPETALPKTNISNPTSTPFSDITYTVVVKDSVGCTNSDTARITVKDVYCERPYIYIPNAFSPNDDGENDVLYVYGEMIETMQLSIYNRWGELVFNSTSVNNGWDGTYQGLKVDPAVFVYHLKVTCLDKDTHEENGNITVVK